MSKTKQRPSAATIVSQSVLEQASVKLQALPDKPKEVWSLRETIALLQDEITSALSRGYTYDEIVKVLADKGINITTSSLKRYLATAKRDRGDAAVIAKPRQPRKPRSPQALAVKPPVTAAKSTAPKRQPTAAKTKTTPQSSSRTRRKAAD